MCAEQVLIAQAVTGQNDDEFFDGYSIYLIPWTTRVFQHMYDPIDSHQVVSTSVEERHFALFMVYIAPLILATIYSFYAFVIGYKGLQQGLSFSSEARKKLWQLRRDFILGNAIFFGALLLDTVLIDYAVIICFRNLADPD